MVNIDLESARDIKSRKTKESMIKATKKILKKHGYASVTVRNICQVAGVTTGAFYHHFDNKDSLLVYITRQGFEDYRRENELELAHMSSLEQIQSLYIWYVRYFAQNGIEMMSHYFSPESIVLKKRFEADEKAEKDPVRSISINILRLIKETQDEGYLRDDVSHVQIFRDLDAGMYGVIFEWCLSEGSFEIGETMQRVIGSTINFYKK